MSGKAPCHAGFALDCRSVRQGGPWTNTTLTDTSSSLIVNGLHGRLAGPFDLRVEGGECVALSGPSGVGKSLLLRMIADLEPARGRVELDGTDRNRMPAPAFRRQVTYVAADAGWWTDIVADHMAYPDRARALLPELGLADALFEAPVATLSLRLALGIQRPLLVAAARMVVQLILVGLFLRQVFALTSPWVTGAVVALMIAAACHEVGSRQERRFQGAWRYGVGGVPVGIATRSRSCWARP